MLNTDKELGCTVPLKAIFFLSIASFASALSLRVTDALLPRLAQEFDVSLGDASYVVTTFSVAYGVTQLFFGPMGDRFGKYLVVAWSCLACAITAALCGIALNFPMLLLARLLAGATAAAIMPLSMAWLGDVIPYGQRQPVLARFLTGQILGISAGILIGGFAADHFSWRVPFFIIAVIFVVVGLTLLSFNRDLPAYACATNKPGGAAIARIAKEFRQVLIAPWARVVLVTVFLEGFFLFGTFSFIASHLHRLHGISLSTAGSVVMLFGFGGLLFTTSAKILVGRLGERGLSRWGGIIVALSFLTIGISPTWYWTLPGCFGAGLGFYMLHNTLQINATQMASERRGAAVAAFASCFYIGQSIGVAVASVLVEAQGTPLTFLLGAAGVLILALNFSRLRKSVADS